MGELPSFDELRDTGLHLQSILLEKRAKAAKADDAAAVGQLSIQFKEINTQMRNLDRTQAEQVQAVMADWKQQINGRGPL